jgi:diaminopimelate decarboxylase/aspartate kinase
MKTWVVMKFGGTSVASGESWRRIADLSRAQLTDHRVWIVTSAVAGITDLLHESVDAALAGDASHVVARIRAEHERLANELQLSSTETAPVFALLDDLAKRLTGITLTEEAPPRLIARILSAGELASTRLGAAALARWGLPVRWVDARDVLRSDPGGPRAARHLEASVTPRRDVAHAESAADGAELVLTQGFVARTPDGETCLLGRGGSDTSAALMAQMLGASDLQIWTDVPGMFTADPHRIPVARLIRRLGYREAQELAAMGAKVLHPRCLGPAAAGDIPVTIRSTLAPEIEGTRIERATDDHPVVTAVTCRTGVTLLTISTLEMWGAHGFLAQVFAHFEALGISVDLVGTSQSALSVTVDKLPGGVDGEVFAQLLRRLEPMGRVRVIHPCAVVSIVGREIRALLHELGSAFEAFQAKPVHLVSDSSENLNLSFVVDESDAPALVAKVHGRLCSAQGGEPRLGPTWEALLGRIAPTPANAQPRWWTARRDELLALTADDPDRALYVYDLASVEQRARRLVGEVPAVDRFYYSMKANPHPRILETVSRAGLGIECVSEAELRHARAVLGDELGHAIPLLFTPNFAPLDEYRVALEMGADVTIDGPHVLVDAPSIFDGAALGLRLDPGEGLGHHEKVRTAGAHAKFGHPAAEVNDVAEAAERIGARITGLHAHVGSGIFDPEAWVRTGRALAALAGSLPDVRWIDVGGGLGVVERPGQSPLDLSALDSGLRALRERLAGIELRMEPGRFVVSEAGVLLAPVTQVRVKSGVAFVGVATGMNSLLRPALYGAWHGVHNLTRLGEAPSGYWHVVGPICESGDVLGRDRRLPRTEPGDVVLIDNAGAYGAAMASRYNLREPADEVVLEPRASSP